MVSNTALVQKLEYLLGGGEQTTYERVECGTTYEAVVDERRSAPTAARAEPRPSRRCSPDQFHPGRGALIPSRPEARP